MALTDRRASEQAGRPLETTISLALQGGASTVLFREKDLPPRERTHLGRRIADMVHNAGAALIVASDAELAAELNADAVHLSTTDVLPNSLMHSGMAFGRSCHNDDELTKAQAEGVMYATLSPIFLTQSKPGYGPALGVDRLIESAQRSSIPVWALGGIDETNVLQCLSKRVAGVAIMGSVMSASDPKIAMMRIIQAMK